MNDKQSHDAEVEYNKQRESRKIQFQYNYMVIDVYPPTRLEGCNYSP